MKLISTLAALVFSTTLMAEAITTKLVCLYEKPVYSNSYEDRYADPKPVLGQDYLELTFDIQKGEVKDFSILEFWSGVNYTRSFKPEVKTKLERGYSYSKVVKVEFFWRYENHYALLNFSEDFSSVELLTWRTFPFDYSLVECRQ